MTIGVPPHGLLATASHREEETGLGCLRATMPATLLDGQHLAARPLWFANATLPIYLCVSTLSDRIDGYANPRHFPIHKPVPYHHHHHHHHHFVPAQTAAFVSFKS
mgnify:CR=1 FL=1